MPIYYFIKDQFPFLYSFISKTTSAIGIANIQKILAFLFFSYLPPMLSLTQVIIEFNDQSHRLEPGKRLSLEELYVDFNILRSGHYQRISLTIHPKTAVVLKRVELQFKQDYQVAERIFCNGFQSWSESREFEQTEYIPRLRRLAQPYLRYYGDEYIDGIQRGKGHLHSWTYSYIRQQKQIRFVGSLLERTGFTLIEHEPAKQLLRVKKDCAQLHLKHSYPTFDLLVMDGEEATVFDQYFSLLECPKPQAPLLTGWTSWYNYYTNISEDILTQNLNALAEKEVPFNVFQIDDGYQDKVGDWLSIKPTFPNGMQHLANVIRDQGFRPGLWLAPFVCEQKSQVFQNHPEWLLKDATGKPIKVGYNPLWGGWYYALDFYHNGVQDYLTKVFYTVLDQWGYGLVKLDFLFAACIQPPEQKTRGQVMHEAMTFLRRLVGDRWILGCGVPLGTCFGLVEYCRIGADIHLGWEHRFLKFIHARERVSTINALRTVLGRWQLNDRAFHNDPDVFLLRENNIQLTPTQQYTLMLVNLLLGNLLFTSDLVGDYQEEQMAELSEVFYWEGREVQEVTNLGNDRFAIYFSYQQQSYVAAINLRKEGLSLRLAGGQEVALEGFESLVVKGE